MESIDDIKAKENGVYTKHSLMETGELRYRLCNKDNTAYIRTENKGDGYWQNSHYHKTAMEVYIVQEGKIIFAELEDEKLKLTIAEKFDECKVRKNIPHNVYMFPNTIVHTVKYGDIIDNDWFESKKLDDLIKNVDINKYN